MAGMVIGGELWTKSRHVPFLNLLLWANSAIWKEKGKPTAARLIYMGCLYACAGSH